MTYSSRDSRINLIFSDVSNPSSENSTPSSVGSDGYLSEVHTEINEIVLPRSAFQPYANSSRVHNLGSMFRPNQPLEFLGNGLGARFIAEVRVPGLLINANQAPDMPRQYDELRDGPRFPLLARLVIDQIEEQQRQPLHLQPNPRIVPPTPRRNTRPEPPAPGTSRRRYP